MRMRKIKSRSESGGIPLLERHNEDAQYRETFVKCMTMPNGSEDGPQSLMGRFQIDAFVQAMIIQREAAAAEKSKKSSLLPGLGLLSSGGRNKQPPRFTVKDMVTFQKDPIPVPLLRIEPGLQEVAVKMFRDVLRIMGVENGKALDSYEESSLVLKVLGALLKHPPLRDEIFCQLQKQTRRNPYRGCCRKAWELMAKCAACFPPDKAISGPLSEYFLAQSEDSDLDAGVRELVLKAWTNLDRTLKAGPRLTVPTAEEVECFTEGRLMTASVFLFDDSVETVLYDMMTTVDQALKDVVGKLKLMKSSGFGWYEWRTTRHPGDSSEPEEPLVEHILLSGKRYMADIMADFRTKSWGGFVQSRFLLKKRIFKPTDSTVSDPVFRHLCFIQMKYDYTSGRYTVTANVAAQLAALQVAADLGCVDSPESFPDWAARLKRAIPKHLENLRSKDDWHGDVLGAFAVLGPLTNDQAKDQFVRIILSLRHGGSIFFTLKREEDSANFFPGRVLLGVNHCGIHFSNIQTKEILHHAELRDISEYAGNPERVFFSMSLSNELHAFEFSTTQGGEICALLDAHIADAVRMLERRS